MDKIGETLNDRGSYRPSTATELGVAAVMLVLLLFVAITRSGPVPGTVSLTVTMPKFSPPVVEVGSSATTTLGAEIGNDYSPPVPTPDEGALSKIYKWSLTVLHSPTAAGSFTDAGPPGPKLNYNYSPNPLPSSGSIPLTFTPLIAGYWHVSASCTVTVKDTKNSNLVWQGSGSAGPVDLTSYELDITYTGPVVGAAPDSGTVVTNKTQNVHAGWPIVVAASFAPTDVNVTYSWAVAGSTGSPATAIKGFAVTPDAAMFYDSRKTGFQGQPTATTTDSVVPLSGSNLSQQAPPTFFFTDSAPHTVSCKVPFAGLNPTATTTFQVGKPSVGLTTTTAATGANLYQVNGDILFGLMGASGEFGITFNAPTIPQGYAGSLEWIQTYDMDRSEQYYNGEYVTYTGTGLDSSFPYEAVLPSGSPVDSPSSGYTPSQFYTVELGTVNDQATMWMMYQPKAGGSILVPLDKVDWDWGGHYGSTPSGEPFISGVYNSLDPAGSATNDYPQWTQFAGDNVTTTN